MVYEKHPPGELVSRLFQINQWTTTQPYTRANYRFTYNMHEFETHYADRAVLKRLHVCDILKKGQKINQGLPGEGVEGRGGDCLHSGVGEFERS